jgi:diguanylate cyclase (GGDEF)-like protein/PAS domain S-box-containing protein
MSAERFARLSCVLGRGVLGAEVVLLALWLLAPQALRPMLLGAAPTKPSTVVAFLLLGAVLGFRLPTPVRRLLLALVVALALEGALANLLTRPLLSAEVLYRESWRAVEPSGQMAMSSALLLLCLVAALGTTRRLPRLATTLGLTAFLLGFASLVGHLYGASALTSLQTATSMALPTVPVALACAVAVLLGSRELPVARAVLAAGTGGRLLRQNLALALVAPPLAGLLVDRGEDAGWFDPAYGQGLMVLVLTGEAVVVVALAARAATRAERAEAVAEDRERLVYLLERTPVGIFETDAEGNRTYVNARWRELTGQAGTGVGTDWATVLHPADAERVQADWAEAVAHGREYSGRYRYLRPDGTVTWVDSAGTAIRDADGAVVRWLGSVTDVTAQVDAQARLADSERRYRSVVTSMVEGVVMHDREGRVVTANDAACHLLGLSRDEMTGVTSTDPRWQAVREDGSDYPPEERPAALARTTARRVRDEIMGVRHTDGSLVWLSVNAEPLFDVELGDGPVGSVTTFSDVTEARTAARALARSEEQFRSAMAHAPVGMALVGLDGKFIEVNRALCRLVGYEEDDLLGRTFQQVTHPDDLESDLEQLARLRAGEVDHYTMEKRYVTSAGHVVWVRLAVSMARGDDDQPAHYIAQMQDVTAARATREKLAHRALHDPLTGLANRELLMDRLAQALSRTARAGTSTVVLFCDLDRFKEVNDSLGHETGDQVLVTVAERLRKAVRPTDTVARLGGDEFVVVAEGLVTDADQRRLADRVRVALARPTRVGAHIVPTGASIGVAVSRPEDDARSLLREADAAMYRAKARGRGRFDAGDGLVEELGPVGT